MALILSGDTGPSIVSASAMPAGSVIQTVNSTTTSGVSSTTSTSFTTSGFSLAITPTSSSNKVFVIFSFNFEGHVTAPNTYVTIYRNSTNILNTNGNLLYNNAGTNMHIPVTLSVLDSPATTSSTTYALYHKVTAGTSSIDTGYGAVTITLMEIKG